ncbi:MAG: ABC transporter ATP-binding protein [Sphingobium sp.]|nr:ABC transporter ATP-binding protein [Sphingobium sp.]
MIRLDNVSKSYKLRHGGRRQVLQNVTAEFPTGVNVGILGLNGAGKSTLIRLLSGAELPDKGTITSTGHISFPLGFASIFHPDLTGRDNLKFLARVYGANIDDMLAYVDWFSQLGRMLDSPTSTYSSGMLAKVAFAASLAIDFDHYLIDEITEVGDGIFREKAAHEFRRKMSHADMVVVSHNPGTIREYCDIAGIIHGGALEMYESVDETLRRFDIICRENAVGDLNYVS